MQKKMNASINQPRLKQQQSRIDQDNLTLLYIINSHNRPQAGRVSSISEQARLQLQLLRLELSERDKNITNTGKQTVQGND